jgi:hypothetical protein
MMISTLRQSVREDGFDFASSIVLVEQRDASQSISNDLCIDVAAAQPAPQTPSSDQASPIVKKRSTIRKAPGQAGRLSDGGFTATLACGTTKSVWSFYVVGIHALQNRAYLLIK